MRISWWLSRLVPVAPADVSASVGPRRQPEVDDRADLVTGVGLAADVGHQSLDDWAEWDARNLVHGWDGMAQLMVVS